MASSTPSLSFFNGTLTSSSSASYSNSQQHFISNPLKATLRSRRQDRTACHIRIRNKASPIRKPEWLKLAICPSSREQSSFFRGRALGSDVSEDTDDLFDDMFEKYGKVVFTRTDQKPSSVEVDDDADSLSFAVAMAKVANEVKAEDIKVLFVKPLVYWTRFFIIATAFSRPQLDAIRTKMANLAEEKFAKFPNGDSKPNSWTLLDFGDVVVHLFLPPQRAFYNLEEFYANATPVELPFEDEKPFQR